MAMLTSPTLQKLLTNIRTLLNQQNPANSFWKDEELTEYVNEAIRVYFTEVVEVNEGHFTATVDLDITADSEIVALPNDFFEMRGLWKKQVDGYVPLDYRNNFNQGWTTNGGSVSETFFPTYYFQGNNLILRPVPNFTEVGGLRLEYMQFPETLINGGDVLSNQISPIFKQVIEMYVVYKAKLKESMVNNVNMYEVPKSNLAELYAKFKETIERRSRNQTYIQPFNPECS